MFLADKPLFYTLNFMNNSSQNSSRPIVLTEMFPLGFLIVLIVVCFCRAVSIEIDLTFMASFTVIKNLRIGSDTT